MSYVSLGCALLLGVIFAVSAVSKSRSKEAFTAFVSAIPNLPISRAPGATTTAAMVVCSEFAWRSFGANPPHQDLGLSPGTRLAGRLYGGDHGLSETRYVATM